MQSNIKFKYKLEVVLRLLMIQLSLLWTREFWLTQISDFDVRFHLKLSVWRNLQRLKIHHSFACHRQMMAFHRRWTLLAAAVVLLCFVRNASSRSSYPWQTLSGQSPVIIAHGGMSGLFPDSTFSAYQFAQQFGAVDTVMYCDVQLTKDGNPVCRSDVVLGNSTVISNQYANMNSTYIVNGQSVTGLFVLDLTAKEVFSFTAQQAFQGRTFYFDGLFSLIAPVYIWQNLPYEPPMWLNIEYPSFYAVHNLSMSAYVTSEVKSYTVNYISSPEVGFLKGIAAALRRSKTKLVWKVLGSNDIDLSVNQTYGSLLKNLTFVKTFASGILLSKNYIWPAINLYLQTPTNIVQQAHAAGLEVYASEFANDEYAYSYNYSYDPVREYLQYMTNNYNFSVDGFLTDFPVTASEARGCYAYNTPPKSTAESPLIISNNGASGDYPACTDVSYKAAVADGADIIDCTVQITKDSVVFCRESPNLLVGTTITQATNFYPSRLKTVPAISNEQAIYTFDLTWAEVQSLTPQTTSPFNYPSYYLLRNPAQASAGKYMNLSAFLDFAEKQSNVSVMINIENARVIIEARELDLVGSIEKVLSTAKYANMSEKIIVKSNESAVLENFKQKTNFKLIYEVSEIGVSIPDSIINQIKQYSSIVSLTRSAIFPTDQTYFLVGQSDVVQQFQKQNISVYVYEFRNEFPALALDYISNPRTELNAFVDIAKVDGLITQYPATARAYLGNRCRFQTSNESRLYSVQPRLLADILSPTPAPLSPPPALSSIVESPLPPVKTRSPQPSPATEGPAAKPPSPSQSKNAGSAAPLPSSFLLLLFLFLVSGLFLVAA